MKKSIKAAIQNVAGFGDTDIFPYTFEQHIFHDKPELLQKALEELHKDFDLHLAEHSPDNVNTLAPVGYTGFRWATQIDPIWNAYYLALVIEMGEAIEKARIPVKENTVFSYRFISPLPDGSIFDDKVNWRAFMETGLETAKKYPFVIVCDIADFYARVYHHRVENALKWLKVRPDIVKRIVELLGEFSGDELAFQLYLLDGNLWESRSDLSKDKVYIRNLRSYEYFALFSLAVRALTEVGVKWGSPEFTAKLHGQWKEGYYPARFNLWRKLAKACIDHIVVAFKKEAKQYSRREGQELTYANYFKSQSSVARILKAGLPGEIKRCARAALRP